MPEHNPYFAFAWKMADRLNRLNQKVPVPRRKCTWCAITAAGLLLVAFSVSLLLIHGRAPAKVYCYSEVSNSGVTAYARSDTPSTTANCAQAAAASGVVKLSSLPAGVNKVCDNGSISVYMTRTQTQALETLGLDPESICS